MELVPSCRCRGTRWGGRSVVVVSDKVVPGAAIGDSGQSIVHRDANRLPSEILDGIPRIPVDGRVGIELGEGGRFVKTPPSGLHGHGPAR